MADDTNVDDLAALSKLDDTLLLAVLKNRYKKDQIYTYVGDILIAINPYKELNIYGKDVSQKYKFVTKKSERDPHIYALADLAYQSMLGKRGLQPANQCFLISGESGAGKTESTKLILRQLMELCNGNTQLEQQILQVNPLLEAFGNAQTMMNDNSSRFGKFILLKFHNGQVLGAKISEYLLEKSRLVKHSQGEQNFHVFYYLFAGKTSEDLDVLQLKQGQPYRYMGKGHGKENQERSKAKYDELINALDLVGFKDQEQADMFTILAGILHLGEVVFSVDQSEAAVIQDSASSQEIITACRFLGIDVTEVSECLTSSISVTRGEYVKRNYTIHQAKDSRDAMAKALYGRLFGWIVNKVNCLVTPKQFVSPADSQEIGILDIFGFEHFETNSFEQACINLANEQLQLFFNQYVFKLEQEEYTKEGIDWTEVKFTDNQHLLDLFLVKPIGILSLLDEECFFPTGSDQSFVDKLNRNFSSLPCYTKSKHSSINFTIHHYAGKVSYDGRNWLEKNRDTFPAGIMEVLQTSSNPLIKLIFGARITRTGSLALQTKRVTTRKYQAGKKSLPEGSKRKVTVSAQFRSSLLNLLERMKSATPVFVRCLKPNHQKVPNQFDSQYVLAQLLYTGMLETTRIRKNGFAVRVTFTEFVDKYKLLVHTPNLTPSAEACHQILNNSGITGWHVGKSKVFLKEHHVDSLVQRLLKLDQSAVHIQRVARGFVSRQKVKQLRELARLEEAQAAAMATQVEQLSRAAANQQEELCRQDEAAAKEKAAAAAAAANPPVVSPVQSAVDTPSPDPHPSSQSTEDEYAVVIRDQPSEKAATPENGRLKPLKDRGRLSTIRESARSVTFRNSSSDYDEEDSDDSFEPESDSEDDYFRSQTNPIQSWFKETQTKGLLQLNGKFPEWFHGVISRRQAESLLDKMGVIGCFLIRVSEVRFGYCLSFKSDDRCRHYMIDQLLNKKYVIVGEAKVHSSLAALAQHHQKNPISNWAGFLTVPCGQRGGVTDYEDLLDQRIVSNLLQSLKKKQNLVV